MLNATAARHPRTARTSVFLRYFTQQPQPAHCHGTRDDVSKCAKHRLCRSQAVCRNPILRSSETLGIEMVARPQQQLVSNTSEASASSHLCSCDEDDKTSASRHVAGSVCTPLHGSINTKSSLASTPLRASSSSQKASRCMGLSNHASSSSSLGCHAGTHGLLSSWSHPVDIDPSEPLVCKPMVRSLTPPHLKRDKSFSLEAYLEDCQNELADLQRNYKSQGSHGLHSLFERVENLSWRLVDLSGKALECSCHRNVPGSMDVYEETNAALDSAATLLCNLISRIANQDEDQRS